MLDVFLLLVYLGTGDQRRLESGSMYFRSIVTCNYFAKEVSRRYGNYSYSDYVPPQDRATAYCVPRTVDPQKVRVY